MKRFFQLFALAIVLSGCATPTAGSHTFARYGRVETVSEADIVAAVAAAEHSGHFPGKPVSSVQVVSSSEINVYYNAWYDPTEFFMVVKRVHGHWEAAYEAALAA